MLKGMVHHDQVERSLEIPDLVLLYANAVRIFQVVGDERIRPAKVPKSVEKQFMEQHAAPAADIENARVKVSAGEPEPIEDFPTFNSSEVPDMKTEARIQSAHEIRREALGGRQRSFHGVVVRGILSRHIRGEIPDLQAFAAHALKIWKGFPQAEHHLAHQILAIARGVSANPACIHGSEI
jgi:hypothetical protein